jgi:hypothetical protein
MIGNRRIGDHGACPNGDNISEEGESPKGTGYAGDKPAQDGEGGDDSGEDAVGEEESSKTKEHGSEGT